MNTNEYFTTIDQSKNKTENYYFFLCFIVIFLISYPSIGFCTNYTGNCSITMGSLIPAGKFAKVFNIERQFEMGVSFDLKKKNWPVSIAFDSSFLYSGSETSKNKYGVKENEDLNFFRSDLYLGIKKIFNLSSVVKPFFGSGLCFSRIYGEMGKKSEITAGIGYWFGAGVYFKLSKHFVCGLHWKKSKTDLKIFDLNANAGGDNFALMAGFHF